MDNNDIEINFVIARLTTLTNQAKIYGGENVLARCDAKQTAEQVFDMFNRALTAIHTLQREIKIRQTEVASQNIIETIQASARNTEDIFTTSELEVFYTSTFTAGKRIENQERIAGVHGDIVENYIADIKQLFEMSEFFASKKLQDSISAHKDFLRSSDWKHGSSCFSWQEWKCLRLQQKLSLQCISLIANSRICEVASVTSKQLNRLVGFIEECNTKICEM